MVDVLERLLQLSVLVAFTSGVLLAWQASWLQRCYLDWRRKRLQVKLAATQKKLDLACDSVWPLHLICGAPAPASLPSYFLPTVLGSSQSHLLKMDIENWARKKNQNKDVA
ncbi:mitoregulin-like [Balaenoptera acutorostrata]|uniref:Mitoregulin-like n=1 Tax=Balaenoptera acutorostrata TaxID=9767 RepID=A0ABM3UJY3_BALAC|nr:mitoregulin-like [Balaenoptera acutorostrata]